MALTKKGAVAALVASISCVATIVAVARPADTAAIAAGVDSTAGVDTTASGGQAHRNDGSAQADSVARRIPLSPTVERKDRAADRHEISRTMGLMGSREVAGPTAWQRRKNPKLAMLLSAVMPGLGQVYNGRRVKVGVAAGAFAFYAGNTLLSKKKADRFEAQRDNFEVGSQGWNFYNGLHEFWKDDARTFLWWTGAAWLLILIDSWIDAHLYDIRAYTPYNESAARESRGGYVTMNFRF